MTMTFRPVVAGTTDVSAIIRIVDSTDGTPETGVAYNTSGIDIRYRRDGATDTAITEATLAALDTAHTDGGFLHIGNGYYRIDLPDAACASGVNGVLVHGTVTGMVVIGTYIPLLAVNPYDTVRMGLTALPNVASGSAGAIPTVGTGTAQINVSGGRADANATYFGGAAGTFASGRPEVNTTNIAGTTLPANGPIPFFGIVDMGTAQSYDGATDKLRLRAAFSSPDVVGCWVWVYSSTNGLHTRGIVTAWDNTNKDATIDTPVQDPTGTLLYVLVASPKSSTALPLASDVYKWNGTTIATPDTAGYPKVTIKDGTGAGEIALTAGAVDTVGAVTGAVGSVTGAVGSVAGAVGSVTGNVGGNVVGSVGSVTGGATAASLNATRYAKNTASQKVYFTLVDSTDHVTRKTGITVTAQRSLDGAAFGSATGTVTEVGSGVYYLSTSTADINADDVVFRFTGTACDPVELHVVTY